jgi:hypothetical protein
MGPLLSSLKITHSASRTNVSRSTVNRYSRFRRALLIALAGLVWGIILLSSLFKAMRKPQYIHPNLPSHILLKDVPWGGQTCNVIHAFAAFIRKVRENSNATNLAVGHWVSHLLLSSELDFEFFSTHRNVSLFLHCDDIEEQPSENMTTQVKNVYCRDWFTNGKFVSIPRDNDGFTVPVSYLDQVIPEPSKLFQKHRASVSIGYLEELTWFRPKQKATSFVENVVEKIREMMVQRNYTILVGLHQRSLDGYCYEWIQHVGEISRRNVLECHPQSKAVRDPLFFVDHRQVQNEPLFRQGGRCFGTPTDGLQMNNIHRNCYLDVSSGYSLCDITLSPRQQSYMRNKSKSFPNNNSFAVLVASDRLVESVHQELRENINNDRLFSLGSVDPSLVFVRGKSTLLLKEMWALAFTDYFISQPFSTCDSIIIHWRHSFMHKSVYSNFPPNCWELYQPNK